MGYKSDPQKKDGAPFYKEKNQCGWVSKSYYSLPYHSSWNLLMPVVEKIEGLFHGGLVVYIKDKRAYIEVDTQASITFDIPEVPQCYSGFCETKLLAVYATVIEFIKWYNEHLTHSQAGER